MGTSNPRLAAYHRPSHAALLLHIGEVRGKMTLTRRPTPTPDESAALDANGSKFALLLLPSFVLGPPALFASLGQPVPGECLC